MDTQQENTHMATPTKINKGHALAFDIEIFSTASSGANSSNKSSGVKQRLEQRRQKGGVEEVSTVNEGMSLSAMLQKLEKANELRLKTITDKKQKVHQKNTQVNETMNQQRTLHQSKIEKLRNQLTADLATHEERRKQKLQDRLLKVQNNLERVKQIKMNKANNPASTSEEVPIESQ